MLSFFFSVSSISIVLMIPKPSCFSAAVVRSTASSSPLLLPWQSNSSSPVSPLGYSVLGISLWADFVGLLCRGQRRAK